MGLHPNALNVGKVMLRHRVDRLVSEILIGRGYVTDQRHVGLHVPHPGEPDAHDHMARSSLLVAGHLSTLGGDDVIAYLHVINEIATPEIRAAKEDLEQVPEAQTRAGVT